MVIIKRSNNIEWQPKNCLLTSVILVNESEKKHSLTKKILKTKTETKKILVTKTKIKLKRFYKNEINIKKKFSKTRKYEKHFCAFY